MTEPKLRRGDAAPDFELLDDKGSKVKLSDYRGKRVVVYFYPKDDTPGCTMEANEFSDLDDAFTLLDTLVIGVSRDECLSHAEFRDKHGLSVLLLSDTESRVCKKYGVLYDKEVEGQKKVAIQRSTFVIDKQGKLLHVLYGVQARGHAHEIYNLIKELK